MPKAIGSGNADPSRHSHRHDPLSQEGRNAASSSRSPSPASGSLFGGERPTLPPLPAPGSTGGPSAHFPPAGPIGLAPLNVADGPAPLGHRLPSLPPENPPMRPPASPRPRFASLAPAQSELPPPSPRPGFAPLPPASPRPERASLASPMPSIPMPYDPIRGDAPASGHGSLLLGQGLPGISSWPDLPPTPFTAFLPPHGSEPFGIAGGGRILPPLDFGPPPPPPNPFMDAVNARFDAAHADLPPKNTRVGFVGPEGERIPAGARTPPPQPKPTWNGTHNAELSEMVDANYGVVRAEKRDQREFINDIVQNPMSDTATKRRELREEMDRIDRDPNSQHLTQTYREELAQLGASHPHLVDENWLLPTRPNSPQPPSP